MAKKMLINVVEPEEIRIAVINDDQLEEFYVERTSETRLLGNIYKGRIVSIEPSIQAAFVDFGIHQNGFLHVSDIMPAYGRSNGKDAPRADIQTLLNKGQEVLVQVSKEEIGTKVPTLTTYISLPGRYMVIMPSVNKRGVSKKISDDDERAALRTLLHQLNPPEGMGCIIRTAGAGRSKAELVADLNYLLKLWQAITKRVRETKSPTLIYHESDLLLRALRDLTNEEIGELVIDEAQAGERARAFLKEVMPSFASPVRIDDAPIPLFTRFKLEQVIENLYRRSVPLSSGGSIVVDQTEALVAIDVNSGRFKDNDNLEETAFVTNCEAAVEVVRQLKLRDLGGVICIDFIDMRSDRHRQHIEQLIREGLRGSRARTRVARMSKFCVLELTRQRVRMSLTRSHYRPCPTCDGSGLIKTAESMGLSVVRQLRHKVAMGGKKPISVCVHPDVATYLRTTKKKALADLKKQLGQTITIRRDRTLRLDSVKFE